MKVYEDEDVTWRTQLHPGYHDFPETGYYSPYDLIAEQQWIEAHPGMEVSVWHVPTTEDWD